MGKINAEDLAGALRNWQALPADMRAELPAKVWDDTVLDGKGGWRTMTKWEVKQAERYIERTEAHLSYAERKRRADERQRRAEELIEIARARGVSEDRLRNATPMIEAVRKATGQH